MPDINSVTPTISRRHLLGGAAAVAGLAWLTPRLATPFMSTPADFIPFLDQLSDILIPGSRVTRPGDFLASVMPTGWRGLSIGQVKAVQHALHQRAQGDFLSLSFSRQYALLSQLDEAVLGEAKQEADAVVAGWSTLKRALLTAYYTSEKGGGHDLSFNLVPGRWEPDIPLSAAPHPLSNDWLAIWFS